MAGILGVSPTTLDRYVAAGCPVETRGELRREYQFNSAAVIAWRDQRDAAAREKAGAAGLTGAESARERYTLASAELKELQLAERRGLMISVEDVAPILADELANVRSRLMAMPGRLATVLADMTDPATIETTIEEEVAGALSELKSG
jgi:phage terminase Nu1 subunit (DNA packaging protein)